MNGTAQNHEGRVLTRLQTWPILQTPNSQIFRKNAKRTYEQEKRLGLLWRCIRVILELHFNSVLPTLLQNVTDAKKQRSKLETGSSTKTLVVVYQTWQFFKPKKGAKLSILVVWRDTARTWCCARWVWKPSTNCRTATNLWDNVTNVTATSHWLYEASLFAAWSSTPVRHRRNDLKKRSGRVVCPACPFRSAHKESLSFVSEIPATVIALPCFNLGGP